MTRLEQVEKVTKIVLSVAVVGTACKIALEDHKVKKVVFGKVTAMLTAIGPHEFDSDKGRMARFCLDLLTRF